MSSTKRKIVISDSDDDDIVAKPLPVLSTPSVSNTSSVKKYSTRSQGSSSSKNATGFVDIRKQMAKYSELGLDGIDFDSEVEVGSEEEDSSMVNVSECKSKYLKPPRRSQPVSMSSSSSKCFRDGILTSEDRREERAELEDESDIDDFIVNDDEEEDEEEEDDVPVRRLKKSHESGTNSKSKSHQSTSSKKGSQSSKSRSFRKSHRSTSRNDDNRYREIYNDHEPDIHDFIADDEDVEEEELTLREMKSRDKKKAKEVNVASKHCKKKRRVVADDNSSDEDRVKVRTKRSESAMAKKRVIDDSESEVEFIDDDEEEDEDKGSEEEVEDEDEVDDSSTDGVGFYARIDAELDRARDVTRESVRDTSHALLGNKFNFEQPVAFRFYYEYLAKVILHLNDRFDLDDIELVDKTKYEMAAKKIEDLLCTTRESLAGSGAWNPKYMSDVQTRPFYELVVDPTPGEYNYANDGRLKCAACNRRLYSNDETWFRFKGPEYDAKDLYRSINWEKYLPEGVLDKDSNATKAISVHGSDDDSVNDDSIASYEDQDDDDDEDHEYRCWPLTVHCKQRSLHTYHVLLHYKLHLMMRIRKQLSQQFDWNVKQMMSQGVEKEYKDYKYKVEKLKTSYSTDNRDVLHDDDGRLMM